MDIAEEIYTDNFVDEYHKMTINLLVTSSRLTHELEVRASKQNITLHQFNVLRILRGLYPESSTNAHIKERMLEKMSDVSRIVNRLVSKGLVHRSKSECDGRAVALTITNKGLEVLQNLDEEMLLADLLQERLSSEECKHLNGLLDKLRG